MTTAPSFSANLVGVNFRDSESREVCYSLEVGTEVRLERDPYNIHDENAIKVIARVPEPVDEITTVDREYFIGFVESRSGIAGQLAPWLDEGYEYRATLIQPIEDKRTPWLMQIEPTGARSVTYNSDEVADDEIPY